jgi:chemotaxis protein methyltransferase CheR
VSTRRFSSSPAPAQPAGDLSRVRRLELPRPELGRDEFRLLRDLLNKTAGLQFDDGSAYLFERRLGDRVVELGLRTFTEYYKYLRFDLDGSRELERALEVLTTAETYFFRQEYQLKGFQKELLPHLATRNASSKLLTVWSAGCSTGEEVYTLAMLIDESDLFRGWDIRVIGSDLSRTRVAFARRGLYRGGSFRTLDDAVRRRYFVERREGAQVIDNIKKLCHFAQLNLLDSARAAIVGRVDVIFCRNVLIYFDAASRRRVIENLYDRLVPGGYLLLGHSESLLNVTTAFELAHLSEDLIYRRPLASDDRTNRIR